MNDKEKLIKLAEIFGDNYHNKPKSLIVPNWGKRFVFNSEMEIVKVQEYGGPVYKTLGEA